MATLGNSQTVAVLLNWRVVELFGATAQTFSVSFLRDCALPPSFSSTTKELHDAERWAIVQCVQDGTRPPDFSLLDMLRLQKCFRSSLKLKIFGERERFGATVPKEFVSAGRRGQAAAAVRKVGKSKKARQDWETLSKRKALW